jgi:hypothetical protein
VQFSQHSSPNCEFSSVLTGLDHEPGTTRLNSLTAAPLTASRFALLGKVPVWFIYPSKIFRTITEFVLSSDTCTQSSFPVITGFGISLCFAFPLAA